MRVFLESIKIDVGYMRSTGTSSIAAWTLAISAHLRMAALVPVCKLRGHQYVDDSHAGPDSGNMAHHCERCGESWSVTLY